MIEVQLCLTLKMALDQYTALNFSQFSETAITFWLPISHHFSSHRQKQYALMVFTVCMIALMLSNPSSSSFCSRTPVFS